jgi:hypothetical protein
LYSFSDVIVLIIENDEFNHQNETINLLIDASKKIEMSHFPDLIVVLNKTELEENEQKLEDLHSNSIQIFEGLFKSIQIISLPISQIHGDLFDKKIHQLNVKINRLFNPKLKIVENLIEIPNTKKFTDKDWWNYIEMLVENSKNFENIFDLQNKIKEHDFNKSIRVFNSFKSNDTVEGYLHSFLSCCKYLILKRNLSTIQWKKFLEYLISKKPISANYLLDSNLFVDFKKFLEIYLKKYSKFNDSELNEELFKIVSQENNLKDLLKEIQLDDAFFEKWNLKSNNFVKLKSQCAEDLCTICQVFEILFTMIRKTKIKFFITNVSITFVTIVMKKLTTNQLVFSVERKLSKEFYLFEIFFLKL